VADVMPSAPNPSTAQARVLVDELARSGVRHAVVCPGSRSAALAIALHEDPRIATHVHVDERSAAFVALGIGRATGVPAVVVVTSGTAVANLLPATVEADHAGVPLLLLTADRPPELRDTGANQTVEQRGLLGPGLRWQCDLGVAEDRADAVRTWRAVAARAAATASGALGGLPGPVHLNVPFREPTVPVADDGRSSADGFTAPTDGRSAFDPWVRVRAARRHADAALVTELAGRFAAVERGIIVVGEGVGGRMAAVHAASTDALSRATGWPVLAEGHTPARRGERTLRAGAWLVGDERFAAAHRPDMVVRFGRTTLDASLARWLTSGVTQILIDEHGGWHDPARTIGELLVAQPDELVTRICAELAVPATSDWHARWDAADAAAAGAVTAALDAEGPLTGLHVARAVLRGAAQEGLLLVGSSLPARDVDRSVEGSARAEVHANRGAAGIDGTVSTALGLAVGSGRPVTALLGDLTWLHDGNALLLSPDAPTPAVTFVVVDNGGGRIFDLLPPARHAPAFSRLFTTPHGRDLTDVARLHGIEATTVTAPEVLSAALGSSSAVSLVLVPVDASADRDLRTALREAVATVLDAQR
jgi:2-succinyl-5-enolpyruvyl-6-hydroxy-3-cyclohexene-1-carboxylate synthase